MQWGNIASSGLSALKAAAATAAEKAAKISEEAEATLTGALNVDHGKPKDDGALPSQEGSAAHGPPQEVVQNTVTSSGLSAASTEASTESPQPGQSFSNLTRVDLEELCASRSQKLQQAVTKYRALHGEYKRVQRDYETLQGIIRDDEIKRSNGQPVNGNMDSDGGEGGGSDISKVKRELKEALKEKAMMQQMLISKDQDIQNLKERLENQAVTASVHAPRKFTDDSLEGLAQRVEELQRMLEQRDVDVAQAVAEVFGLYFYCD
jgi:hypothetical protein